ncbi:MAG: RNA 2',3'-cyclic phosphodiesterase [Betaproteobacteria bacterium]
MTVAVPETVRLFFALWPDPSIAEKMHRLARRYVDQYGGRAMRPETLHLTLAFLGDLPATRLQDALAAGTEVHAAAFQFVLDRIGYWRHNRLLWAGCGIADPALSALAATLHKRLQEHGFVLEKRGFVPHLTLARNLIRKPVGEEAMPVAGWHARAFVLVRSAPLAAGAAYQVVGEWPLEN